MLTNYIDAIKDAYDNVCIGIRTRRSVFDEFLISIRLH